MAQGSERALDPTLHIGFCTRIVFNSFHTFSADIIPGQRNFVFLTDSFYTETSKKEGRSE